jgi:hypothetical protein
VLSGAGEVLADHTAAHAAAHGCTTRTAYLQPACTPPSPQLPGRVDVVVSSGADGRGGELSFSGRNALARHLVAPRSVPHRHSERVVIRLEMGLGSPATGVVLVVALLASLQTGAIRRRPATRASRGSAHHALHCSAPGPPVPEGCCERRAHPLERGQWRWNGSHVTGHYARRGTRTVPTRAARPFLAFRACCRWRAYGACRVAGVFVSCRRLTGARARHRCRGAALAPGQSATQLFRARRGAYRTHVHPLLPCHDACDDCVAGGC